MGRLVLHFHKQILVFCFLLFFIVRKFSYAQEQVDRVTLPWCKNNSHVIGEWIRYSTAPPKSYVCCGGGYAGPYGQRPPYDMEKVPGYCYPKNTVPTFFENGYVEYGAQCGDDCCRCDRDDNTRLTPNEREMYYWKPAFCRLQDWNATLFCELLGDRTILLMGDSSMQQTSSTLMSMITAGNGTCGPRILFARSDHVVFGFKGHNNYAEVADRVNPNISIVTAGPHIDDTGDVNHILTQMNLHHATRKTRGQPIPTPVWKTQNPGHLGCEHITAPVKKFTPNVTIRDRYRWNTFQEFDEFMRIRAPVVNFKLIDMAPLYLRPDGHIWGKKEDCLHYCQPGPINIFSNILLQMLFNKEL